jgi:hypothetical protein
LWRLDACIDDLPGLCAAADVLDDPALMAVLINGAFTALSFRRPGHPDFAAWEARNLALFQRRLPKSETIRRGLELMIRSGSNAVLGCAHAERRDVPPGGGREHRRAEEHAGDAG